MKEKFSITLKNGIYGGLCPKLDKFDHDYFYVGDGWGSSFASMRIRKLSLKDGGEVASFLVKNQIRCIYFSQNRSDLFVMSDKKFFILNREDLTLKEKFDKKVPNYSDYVSFDENENLLLANFVAQSLSIFNIKTQKTIKKRISASRGIFKEDENNYLFASPYDGIYRYNLAKNKHELVLPTTLYSSIKILKNGTIFLQSASFVEKTETTHERLAPISEIKIYKNLEDKNPKTLNFDFNFDSFEILENENKLFLIDRNKLNIYDISSKSLQKYKFNNNIRSIIIKKKSIFTLDSIDGNKLTCYEL
ncbi:MAG: hypothetical protein ACK5LP_00650 [Campylobacteraceae bacterium]